jgi:hypothetical protein
MQPIAGTVARTSTLADYARLAGRPLLAGYVRQRITVTARYERLTIDSVGRRALALLREVRLAGSDLLLADHLWMPTTPAWSQKIDGRGPVRFTALVYRYRRGNGSVSYKLIAPQDMERIRKSDDLTPATFYPLVHADNRDDDPAHGEEVGRALRPANRGDAVGPVSAEYP